MSEEQIRQLMEYVMRTGELLATEAYRAALLKTIAGNIGLLVFGIFGIWASLRGWNKRDLEWQSDREIVAILSALGLGISVLIVLAATTALVAYRYYTLKAVFELIGG